MAITGDTAHDEDAATYEAVLKELKDWNGSVRIVPGNDDKRLALRDLFPQAGDPCEGRVTFYKQWDDWQVIGLDSQRPIELAGSLNDEQNTWLRNRLETAKQRDTLMLLHHPPIAVQCPWLDKIGLQDAAELELLLRDHQYPRERAAFRTTPNRPHWLAPRGGIGRERWHRLYGEPRGRRSCGQWRRDGNFSCGGCWFSRRGDVHGGG